MRVPGIARLVSWLGFALLAAHPAAALVVLNDGLTHVVDDARYATEIVRVEDGVGGVPTRLVLAPGGVAQQLIASGTSRIEISGGSVTDRIYPNAGASLVVSAGSVYQVLNGTGSVTLTGGVVDFLYVDYGTTIVTGGRISSRFQVSGFATAYLYGGALDGLLVGFDFGQIRVYGSRFAVDGVATLLGPVSALYGDVTGLHPDDSPFAFEFSRGGSSSSLVFVPEPGTLLLASLGLCTLAAGFPTRARRARAAR